MKCAINVQKQVFKKYLQKVARNQARYFAERSKELGNEYEKVARIWAKEYTSNVFRNRAKVLGNGRKELVKKGCKKCSKKLGKKVCKKNSKEQERNI